MTTAETDMAREIHNIYETKENPNKVMTREEKKIAEEREVAKKFGQAFRMFERGLGDLLNHERIKLSSACDKIDKKIKHAEKKVVRALIKQRRICDEDLELADRLVKKELRSKIITSQWTNSFLAVSDDEYLDPVSFAFARFAMNMCLCYTDVSPEYIIQSKSHILLVGLMTFESELVVGPAIMATMHISLYPIIKPELILAGVLPALLNIFIRTESQPILSQACKLCGSLALHEANKAQLVNSGVLHALLDLTGGAHKIVNKHTQYAAAVAVVNIIYNSDTNRGLVIDLNGITPLMGAIRLSSDNDIILQCMKSINNVVYCNSYAAGQFLNVAADQAIVEVLQGTDITKNPGMVHACLSCLANFCNSEATQSHIASGGGIACAVLAAQHSNQPVIIAECGNFFYALSWNNLGNKTVLAARGCVEVLYHTLIRLAKDNSEAGIIAFVKSGNALASLLLYQTNHERLFRMNKATGLQKLVNIAKRTDNSDKLIALGKIIVMLIPSPEIILKNHIEECEIPVEIAGCQPCLKKIKLAGYGHGKAPEWLEKGMKYLVQTDFELSQEPKWVKHEYDEKIVNFKELWTDIHPDADIFEDVKVGSLLLSIF